MPYAESMVEARALPVDSSDSAAKVLHVAIEVDNENVGACQRVRFALEEEEKKRRTENGSSRFVACCREIRKRQNKQITRRIGCVFLAKKSESDKEKVCKQVLPANKETQCDKKRVCKQVLEVPVQTGQRREARLG